MSTAKDILSDIESDLGHLYHLLDIAVETLIKVDHGESPSNRPYLERLGAILWIARDRVQGVIGDLDRTHAARRARREQNQRSAA